jgi:hypothetical protein
MNRSTQPVQSAHLVIFTINTYLKLNLSAKLHIEKIDHRVGNQTYI